jgi:hypothetical protein
MHFRKMFEISIFKFKYLCVLIAPNLEKTPSMLFPWGILDKNLHVNKHVAIVLYD